MNPPRRALNALYPIEETNKNSTSEALEGWLKITPKLGYLEEYDGAYTATVKYLELISNQIKETKERLAIKEVPEALYTVQFDAALKALSPRHLRSNWHSVSIQFTPDIYLALEWSSWVIGCIENPISESDLKELLESLNELDTLIAEPGLPDSLRDLIQKNVREIREAIELYPIIGANGLKVATQRLFGEAIFQKEVLHSASASSNTNTKKAYEKFVQVIKSAVNAFNTTVSTAENMLKLADLGPVLKITFSS